MWRRDSVLLHLLSSFVIKELIELKNTCVKNEELGKAMLQKGVMMEEGGYYLARALENRNKYTNQ